MQLYSTGTQSHPTAWSLVYLSTLQNVNFSVEMTLELFLKRCENQIHCSTKPRVTHLQGCSREEYVHSVYERL